MNVLFISYDGLTDSLGQSQILPYLKGLSKKGHQISIVSFEKPQLKSQIDAIQEDLKSDKIQWFPLIYTKYPPVLSTVYDIFKLIKITRVLIKKLNIEILHCRSYISSLVGLHFKKRLGIKFIFDMRGFWADERIDGEIWNLKNPIYKLIYKYFKAKELDYLQFSDYTISLTNAGKNEIEKFTKTPIAPIKIIPCCVDNELFDMESVNIEKVIEHRNTLGIKEGQFVLGYIGSIGTWYMLSEMVSFYKELLKSKPKSVFLFITKEDPSVIIKQFNLFQVSTEYLRIKSANRQEVPVLISLIDWSIFFIKPLFSKLASSPTKQGEIMSMGKPLICNSKIGDSEAIVLQNNAGLVLDDFESDSYLSIIDSITSYEYDPNKIRQASEEIFSLIHGIECYHEVYEFCGGNSH